MVDGRAGFRGDGAVRAAGDEAPVRRGPVRDRAACRHGRCPPRRQVCSGAGGGGELTWIEYLVSMNRSELPKSEYPAEWKQYRPEITFVVGAGASKGFDLPVTGEIVEGLKAEPLRYHRSISEFYARFNPLSESKCAAHAEYLLKNFSRELRLSSQDSIDAFLERRAEEFGEIGKLVIASALLPKQELMIESFPGSDSWHSYLYTRYLAQFEDWSQAPIAFVVFNYDHILELALFLARAHSHGSNDHRRSWSEVSKLHLIHVYGSLGTTVQPTLSNDDRQITIGHSMMHIRMNEALKQIRVVSDRTVDMECFDIARGWVQSCKKLVFLGFAMDDTNLNRIGLPTGRTITMPSEGVFASAIKLPRMAQQRLEEAFAWRGGVHNEQGQCVFGRTHEACRQFLSEYVL